MQVHSRIDTSSPPPPALAGQNARKTVYFSGRVQGVGFRYTARSVALQYDVHGYVRNLSDGRVELVLEGAEAEANRVVDDIRRKMSGFVRNITVQSTPATGEFDHFSIRH